MTNKRKYGLRKYGLVGIGNAIVDVLTRVEDSFLAQQAIRKGAMTLQDEKESHGLYMQLEPAMEVSGGSAANSLAVFASLGGSGAFIGKVADDQLGEIFTHDIRASGVDFLTPPLEGGAATARCLIMVTPDAERSMCTYLGACAELSAADLDRAMIEDAKITLLEGYLFDKDNAKEAFREASRIAHAAGNKVALTLSDAKCVERHHAEFMDLLERHVDILFANEKEIAALCKTNDIQAAAEMVRGYCDVAVLTLGSKGAMVVTPQETIRVAPAKVAQVVDTTGAGDSFSATFLFGMTEGWPLAECGRMSAEVAGEIISQIGARPQRPLKDLIAEKAPVSAPRVSKKQKPPRFG